MGESREIPAEVLATAIETAESKASIASEAKADGNSALRAAIEDYGLNRKALNFVRGLRNLEPERQQSTLRAVAEYAEKLGMFDQADLLEDAPAEASAETGDAEPEAKPRGKKKAAAKSDPVKDRILQPAA